MEKKNLLIFSTIAMSSLIGCSSTESYQEKMHRYAPKHKTVNHVPEISQDGFRFETKSKGSRGPASVGTQAKKSTENTEHPSLNLSNKKLYFLTLFGQYENMKKFSSNYQAPSVEICPHFHTSLLEHKTEKVATAAISAPATSFNYDVKEFYNPAYVSKYPELSLPLVKDEAHPKVIDILRNQGPNISSAKVNEILTKAIDIHIAKTYTEVRELCEFGVSENYYVYENLISHIKSNSFPKEESNLGSLLKTTIFSNMAIATSLESKAPRVPSRGIASVKKEQPATYSNEVISRLNVDWAQDYFEYIKNSK